MFKRRQPCRVACHASGADGAVASSGGLWKLVECPDGAWLNDCAGWTEEARVARRRDRVVAFATESGWASGARCLRRATRQEAEGVGGTRLRRDCACGAEVACRTLPAWGVGPAGSFAAEEASIALPSDDTAKAEAASLARCALACRLQPKRVAVGAIGAVHWQCRIARAEVPQRALHWVDCPAGAVEACNAVITLKLAKSPAKLACWARNG